MPKQQRSFVYAPPYRPTYPSLPLCTSLATPPGCRKFFNETHVSASTCPIFLLVQARVWLNELGKSLPSRTAMYSCAGCALHKYPQVEAENLASTLHTKPSALTCCSASRRKALSPHQAVCLQGCIFSPFFARAP